LHLAASSVHQSSGLARVIWITLSLGDWRRGAFPKTLRGWNRLRPPQQHAAATGAADGPSLRHQRFR